MANDATMSKAAAEQPAAAERTRSGRCYRPQCDILERDDELLVVTDVPGSRGDQIDVRFEDGTLSIYAKVEPRHDQEAEYLLREYGVGDYYRTFQVSEVIDASKITAEHASGVLTLHLPKAEAVRPRKIDVKAG